MRLINTKTLALQEFFEGYIPAYAILSHTWGAEEITYHDWLYVTKQNPSRWGWVYLDDEIDKIKSQMGYHKITSACARAREDDLEWLWVDTNCIDKTNSAELSEAINSMFRWYKQARHCYVFLADVSSSSVDVCRTKNSEFCNSRWFKRGWTLQELIAPKSLIFFSATWAPICSRNSTEIADPISRITGIPKKILHGGFIKSSNPWEQYLSTTADILSWASERKTTRIEDMAYCLLGLLDINMPLLYGEGSKAFFRLQLEILKNTTELSLLAWQPISSSSKRLETEASTSRLPTLARQPSVFFGAGHPLSALGIISAPINIAVTNIGLSLRLQLVDTLDEELKFAVIVPQSLYSRSVWMPVVKHDHGYVRIRFLSSTLIVPRAVWGSAWEGTQLNFQPEIQEIVLPIYDDLLHVSWGPAGIQPLRQAQSHNILLTFPYGLHPYRVLNRYSGLHGSHDRSLDDEFCWNDLFLGLIISEHDPKTLFAAVEFGTVLDPSGETDGRPGRSDERKAILFIVHLDEASVPDCWTCLDISHPLFRFDEQAKAKMRNAGDPASWKQQCLLEHTGRPGFVIMDDLDRDLSTAEWGGYWRSEETSGVTDDVDSRVDEGHYPLIAQIALPAPNTSIAPSR